MFSCMIIVQENMHSCRIRVEESLCPRLEHMSILTRRRFSFLGFSMR